MALSCSMDFGKFNILYNLGHKKKKITSFEVTLYIKKRQWPKTIRRFFFLNLYENFDI